MSLKRLNKHMRLRKPGLASKVEIERSSDPDRAQADTLDPDLLEYVDNFLQSYAKIPPLEPTSLLTKEDAQKAVVVLDKANEQIQAHLKTARALKQLLEAKKRDMDS